MPLAYVAWRAGTTYRVVVPVRHAGNRFLDPLKGLQIQALVYKYGLSLKIRAEPVFLNVMKPRNRFLGIDSAILCSLAGWYDEWGCRTGPQGWESIPGLLKRSSETVSGRAGTTTLFLLGP
jgi:hypothetical protein